MVSSIIFAVIGYLSGSLLFARYFGSAIAKKDITHQSADKNPGAFNAFRYGGIACGTATAAADMLKGFAPIFIYRMFFAQTPWGIAVVLAAPVIGHCFSAYHKFKGGKGISVTFGSLLGLAPDLITVSVLGVIFIIFSTIIKITPHAYRTLLSYLLAALVLPFVIHNTAVYIGYLIITGTVTTKLALTGELRGMVDLGAVSRLLRHEKKK